MTDHELDNLLKSAPVPERPAEYWEQFPKRVLTKLHWEERRAENEPQSRAGVSPAFPHLERVGRGRRDACPTLVHGPDARLQAVEATHDRVGPHARTLAAARLRQLFPALALGAAAACVLLGFALGFWRGQRYGVTEPQLAQARKCFQEIEALFPNQVRAIVFDQQRARLVLSEQADVPASPPLYVKICGPQGCVSYVTFSGQQIRVNGDVFEVLVDRQGGVLLVGRDTVWSSNQAQAKSGPYRIEAKPLEVAS